MKKQAEREGGQFLILSPQEGSAAALSALPFSTVSGGKGTDNSVTAQENNEKSANKNWILTAYNEKEPAVGDSAISTHIEGQAAQTTGSADKGTTNSVTAQENGEKSGARVVNFDNPFVPEGYFGEGYDVSRLLDDRGNKSVYTEAYEIATTDLIMKGATEMQEMQERSLEYLETLKEKYNSPRGARGVIQSEIAKEIGRLTAIAEHMPEEGAMPKSDEELIADIDKRIAELKARAEKASGVFEKGKILAQVAHLESERRKLGGGSPTNDGSVRFRFADDNVDFDVLRDKAVEQKGLVMPGLADKEVQVMSVQPHQFSNIKGAKQWAEKNIVGQFTLTDSSGNEREYTISNSAINEYLNQSTTDKSVDLDTHLSVLTALPEVISNSIEAEVHADYVKDADGKRSAENEHNPDVLIHRFYGATDIKGTQYRVKTTIKEYRDTNQGAKAYSYEVTEIELLPSTHRGDASAPLPRGNNSSISGAKLLEGVGKSYEKGKNLLVESEKSDFSLQNRGETEENVGSGVRFREVVNDDGEKTLVGIHNITAGKLLKALRWVGDKEKVLDWLELNPPKGSRALTDQELSVAKIINDFENPNISAENYRQRSEKVAQSPITPSQERAVGQAVALGERLGTRVRVARSVEDVDHPQVRMAIEGGKRAPEQGKPIYPHAYEVSEIELGILGKPNTPNLGANLLGKPSFSVAKLLNGVEKTFGNGKIFTFNNINGISQAKIDRASAPTAEQRALGELVVEQLRACGIEVSLDEAELVSVLDAEERLQAMMKKRSPETATMQRTQEGFGNNATGMYE